MLSPPILTEPTKVVSVTLTLDQLVAAIRQLDEPGRARVAQTLLDLDRQARWSSFIERLYAHEPADNITDDMINAEIKAVREEGAAQRYTTRSH